MAYIEKDLPYSAREEMREHLEECEACRAAYEKKLFIREQFCGAFNEEQLVFSSVKQGVMNAIRNTEIEASWFEKIYSHFKKFGSIYASLAAMFAFVILVVPNMGGMMKKDSKSICIKDEASNKADYEYKDSLTNTIIPNELKGSNEALDKVLSEIKAKELGVGPWRTVFADNNRIYFYNYSHLLVCDNSLAKKGITGAVDLIKIDLDGYQGSSVVKFLPSNNGDYCVIVNRIDELDMINDKKPLYMYNAKNNSLQAIGQENLALISTAWSNSSQYFAYGDIKGEMITIFDTDRMKKQQVNFNKGEIQKLFVADNGDVLINSNKIYLLKKENGYKTISLNVSGDALGFKDNEVIYFNNGSIYKYYSKGSTEINKLGADYKLYKEDKENIIFRNDKNLKIYNIKNNGIQECSSKYLQTSKKFSPDFKKFIDNDAQCVRVINDDGTVSEGTKIGASYDSYWMDNNTLVRVNFKENFKYLGDFVIEKIDVNTGKSTIIYEMK